MKIGRKYVEKLTEMHGQTDGWYASVHAEIETRDDARMATVWIGGRARPTAYANLSQEVRAADCRELADFFNELAEALS